MTMKSTLEAEIIRTTHCTDAESLEAWQMARLRETICCAREKNDFYRTLYAQLDENKLRTRRDLARLPLLDDLLLRTDPFRLLCCPQSEVARIVTLRTSGTAASPKRIFFSANDQNSTLDFFVAGMREMVGAGDKIMIFLPSKREGSVGSLLSRALEIIGVTPVPAPEDGDLACCYRALRESGCVSAVMLPVQALALSQYGMTLPKAERVTLKNVLLSADRVGTALRKRVADQLSCEVFTHFGMTEMGFGVAVECSAHTGCHIREDAVLVEVIDPVTLLPLPDGEVGEFVFTTLTREAMPLFRYRTGDLGYLVSERCPCGSFVRRMVPTLGRRDDRIDLPDGSSLTLSQLEEGIFSCGDMVDYEATLSDNTLTLTLFALGVLDTEAVRQLAAVLPLSEDGFVALCAQVLTRLPRSDRKHSIRKDKEITP